MRLTNKIYIFLTAMIFAACSSSDECREETDVYMQAGFYTKTLSPTTNKYSTTSLSIDSLWVNGLGIDSFLYRDKKSIKAIQVSLKKTEMQSDFIVRFNDITDTISVFYQNNDRYYLSLECGCIVVHKIDEVVSTNHFIDSISIINRDINTANAENIQIYHF